MINNRGMIRANQEIQRDTRKFIETTTATTTTITTNNTKVMGMIDIGRYSLYQFTKIYGLDSTSVK